MPSLLPLPGRPQTGSELGRGQPCPGPTLQRLPRGRGIHNPGDENAYRTVNSRTARWVRLPELAVRTTV